MISSFSLVARPFSALENALSGAIETRTPFASERSRRWPGRPLRPSVAGRYRHASGVQKDLTTPVKIFLVGRADFFDHGRRRRRREHPVVVPHRGATRRSRLAETLLDSTAWGQELGDRFTAGPHGLVHNRSAQARPASAATKKGPKAPAWNTTFLSERRCQYRKRKHRQTRLPVALSHEPEASRYPKHVRGLASLEARPKLPQLPRALGGSGIAFAQIEPLEDGAGIFALVAESPQFRQTTMAAYGKDGDG